MRTPDRVERVARAGIEKNVSKMEMKKTDEMI
jgi:hypothetical protein